MANIQNQLGLGLAVKQSQEMLGNQNYNVTTQNPSGTKGIAFSMEEPGKGGPVGSPYITSVPATPTFTEQSVGPYTQSNAQRVASTPTAPTTYSRSFIANGQANTTGFRQATSGMNKDQRVAYRKGLGTQVGASPADMGVDLYTTQQELANAVGKVGSEFAKGEEEKFALDTQRAMDALKEREAIQNQSQSIIDQQEEQEAQIRANAMEQNQRYLAGAIGVPVSEAGLQGQRQALDMAQRAVANLRTINSNNAKLSATAFKSQLDELQRNMEYKVSQDVQSTLVNLGKLDAMGKLDSIEAVQKARADLLGQLKQNYEAYTSTYLPAMEKIMQRAQEEEKYYREQQKFDSAITDRIADGFLYNARGEKIIGDTGLPLKVGNNMGKLLSTTPVQLNNGMYGMIYQNPDGSMRIEQIKDSAQIMNDDATKFVTELIKSGKITDVSQIPESVRNNLPSYALTGLTGGGTGDLRYLAPNYPGQAWAKNNNPAGITWNANFDKGTGTAKLLADAGINFSKGTPRPANEGGNYVTFDTIEDGLRAQQIIMSQTYGNSTVGQMLGSWVGTAEAPNYAKQVAGMAGVDVNTRVSDLTPEQLGTLQMAKIQKESPGLAKLLSQGTTQTAGLDQKAEAMALVQGLGGTEGERATFAKNILDRANKKNISLIEAKKELGYKTLDDKNFEETRKQQYTEMRKDYSERTGNAKTALTLLNQPQTAVGDVASVVGFLKTIDSASVARESEVASVENARGIIDGLLNTFQKAKEGTKLTDTQRQQLIGAIQTIVDAQDKKFNETVANLKTEFDSRGLDATVYIPQSTIDKALKAQTTEQAATPIFDKEALKAKIKAKFQK